MANENQGAAVSPQVRQKAERGGTQAPKRPKISAPPRAPWPINIWDRAEEVWDDARDRVRSFQDDSKQYIRKNPSKAVFTALGAVFVSFNFSSLRTVDAKGHPNRGPSLSSRLTSRRCFQLLWQ